MNILPKSVEGFIDGVGELATVAFERLSSLSQSPDVAVTNIDRATGAMGIEPYVDPQIKKIETAPVVGRIAAEMAPAIPVETPEAMIAADQSLAPVVSLDEQLEKLRQQVEAARLAPQQVETAPEVTTKQPAVDLAPVSRISEQQDTHLEDLRRQVQRAIGEVA